MGSPARLSLRHALALGLAHGPTELLPISSSAHTILIPFLAGWPYAELDPELRKSFEVALHAGTAAALLVDLRSLESHPVLRAVLERLGRGAPPAARGQTPASSPGRSGAPGDGSAGFPPARRCSSSRSPSSRRRSSATPSSSPSNAVSAVRTTIVAGLLARGRGDGARRRRAPRTGTRPLAQASARRRAAARPGPDLCAGPRGLAQRRGAHRRARARVRPRRLPARSLVAPGCR